MINSERFSLRIVILIGFFSTLLANQGVSQTIRADWDEAATVYSKQNVTILVLPEQDSLMVRVRIEDPVIIDQIRLCGFSLYVNDRGKKKEESGVQYPVGFDQAQLPRDPERLQIALSNLPPFEISDQRQQYGIYREAELSLGSLPSPSGLRIEWFSSIDGLDLTFVLPKEITGAEPGETIRIGWRCGVLDRPDITGSDGVGIYGTNPSNPTVITDAATRARLNMFERYREFTVERGGWSAKWVMPE